MTKRPRLVRRQPGIMTVNGIAMRGEIIQSYDRGEISSSDRVRVQVKEIMANAIEGAKKDDQS